MPAATGLIFTVFLTAFLLGCHASRNVLTVADNTTINLTCVDGMYYPTWFVNGTTVRTEGLSGYRSSFSIEGGNVTATLTIDGNRICGTLNVYCIVYVIDAEQLVSMHNTSLTIQGHLPSPENVHVNESVNASIIEWKPPYSTMNNDIIHVDPHITQYTVYITDIYTGNTIVRKNVTGTQFFSNIQDDDLCPMYQVSAWNAGGEGELSEPVQKIPSRAPYSIAAETISVAVTAETHALRIYIDVDTVCTSRMPEFFIITMMTTAGRIFNEAFRQHQPGQPVANITLTLSKTVDVCNFHVRISAGNSAGMSTPSEAVEVAIQDCSGGSSGSTTTTTVTASSTTVTTESENVQQGDNTLLIVIIIGVIAATGVTLTVAVGIICCLLKHKSKNRKAEHSKQSNYDCSESPSLSGHGPIPLDNPPVTEVVYVTTEQTSSRPVAQTSHSAASSRRGSSDQLLEPSLPVSAGSPHLMYGQLNMKQAQVRPPVNGNCIQYAQIEHQDKM